MLLSPFMMLARHWDVFARTTVSEIRSRYAGSVLGLIWMLIAPLLLMAIYATVYLFIFRVRPVEMSSWQYVIYVLSGLLPFLGFSEALSAGSMSLTLNRAILLSTVFPAELVPLRAVVSAQAPSLIGLFLCIALAAVLGNASVSMLAIPFIWLALLMFVSGIVLALSLVSLLVRDVQQALGFVNMVLLIASPIAYTPSMVPERVRGLLAINPLSHFIDAMHETIVFGRTPSWRATVVMAVLALGSFSGGFWLFQRVKRVLFDYA